ncbi:MAG TPA: hypothetical protein VEK39_02025 [Solirubrobacterales bacterium]|nr:hypothetical protein [Solirubrobacterales bacterium]
MRLALTFLAGAIAVLVSRARPTPRRATWVSPSASDDNDTGTEAACAGVDGLDAPTSVAVSSDGHSLYMTSAFDAAVVNFDRDPATGALAFAQCFDDDESGPKRGARLSNVTT